MESLDRLALLRARTSGQSAATSLTNAKTGSEQFGLDFMRKAAGDRLRGIKYDSERKFNEQEQGRQKTSYNMYALPTLIKQLEANLALTNAQASATQYSLPGLRNQANFANTPWGKKISPALGDAKSISLFLKSLIRPF